MAITFVEKRKRLRSLVFVFLAILAAIIIIVLRPTIFDLLVEVKPLVSPPLELTEEKIEIDFGALADPLLVTFRPFEFSAFPRPEAKDVPLMPTLEWQSVPGAETYEWEIFGVESGKTEQTSVTVTKKLTPSTTYVWRVRSCTEENICSAWSGQVFTASFVILPPDLIAPLEEQIIEEEVTEEENAEEETAEELRETEGAGRENPFIFY
jgi:hypothetical protein